MVWGRPLQPQTLGGSLSGQRELIGSRLPTEFSIRINQQYRVCFIWEEGHPSYEPPKYVTVFIITILIAVILPRQNTVLNISRFVRAVIISTILQLIDNHHLPTAKSRMSIAFIGQKTKTLKMLNFAV